MKTTLSSALESLPNTAIVTLTTRTRPKLLRKSRTTGLPCPYPNGVEHLCQRNGILGCSYENCVNNQRTREGTAVDVFDELRHFNARALWQGNGEHVDGNRYLVRNKNTGKEYLQFKPQGKVLSEKWFDVFTGRELTPQEVDGLANYLPLPSTNKEHQEVAKEVFWRTIAVENIVQIDCGECYEVSVINPITEVA